MAMPLRSFLLALSALLASTGASAQLLTFGQWTFGRTSDGFYASTTNDSGHALGRYCHGESCVYLLGVTNACTKGDRYPVLVNTTSGSRTLEVYCNGPLEGGNKYQYAFTAFDDVERMVFRAPKVGFAIPFAGAAFTVVRFSLIGSNEAIAAMTAAAIASTAPAPVQRRNTRDERL